ncbi:tripartite tricarboxylate transporter TctB family protein [Starkeya koreensis]|uniref:Tripartite tricarboxylate transporter TctB family protein n=1 Tax=Ancylobacter koreensis TaxID=266121 RepID=A0ABT0DGW4_9HYPH|nr:tripartite tricarboxylate transporter TctB family protein [Ancylobacter koreensis]MCK0206449.1 tripartite tricarboxylate transporter TctB family protein [Ancylobacter koreensis]
MKTSILGNKDFLGGLLLVAIGAGAAFISRSYPMGTLRQMGPGFMPFSLALLLMGLGLLLALRAPHDGEELEWGGGLRPVLVVLGAVLLFAQVLEPLGLVLSSMILIIASSLAHTPFRLRETLLLSVGLTVGVVLLFAYALEIPFALWPRGL